MRSFGIFFNVRLNKRMGKQSGRRMIWNDMALIVTSLQYCYNCFCLLKCNFYQLMLAE